MTSKPSHYVVTEVCPNEWDALVKSFPDATIYHTKAWLDLLSSMYGLKAILAQARIHEKCVAVWPYLIQRKGPLKIYGSPLPGWSTAYMGPLFAQDVHCEDILRAFLDHKLFRRYAFFACKVIVRTHQMDLSAFGFTRIRNFDTYIINLAKGEDVLWDNLKSECRSRIRKAERLGIEVIREDSESFLDDYWKMTIETYAKSKLSPPHVKQFGHELWNKLKPLNQVLGYSAIHKGQRVASLILPFDHKTMYYWGGASFQEYRKLPAHNALQWTAICDACRSGLKQYDLISTIGGPGRFKKTFNPETVNIASHWERCSSKLMAFLKERYERRLRKRRRVAE